MYKELGGYVGYQQTPLRELLECRISIIAEWNVQAERDEEMKNKQAEQEDEMERQKRKLRQ